MITQILIAACFVLGPLSAIGAWWWSLKRTRTNTPSSTDDVRVIFTGFLTALAASLFWGVGNFVTAYSVKAFAVKSSPRATLDISLANYASGSITIGLIGIAAMLARHTAREELTVLRQFWTGRVALAALFKGINTYAFCASLAFVSSSVAATVENLYLVWAGIFASIASQLIPKVTWLISVGVVLIGAYLILSPGVAGDRDHLFGIALALVAGLAFAIFMIFWGQSSTENIPIGVRGLLTAAFLALSGGMIILVHLSFGHLLFGGEWTPFATLSGRHLLIQLGNGVFNIGVTYFLVGEALRLLKRLGALAALVVLIGMSYAVLVTFVAELIWNHASASIDQWIGMGLFTFGIATTRRASQS
jgi:drug/metabolite transporter (DMT)-like permease